MVMMILMLVVIVLVSNIFCTFLWKHVETETAPSNCLAQLAKANHSHAPWAWPVLQWNPMTAVSLERRGILSFIGGTWWNPVPIPQHP